MWIDLSNVFEIWIFQHDEKIIADEAGRKKGKVHIFIIILETRMTGQLVGISI